MSVPKTFGPTTGDTNGNSKELKPVITFCVEVGFVSFPLHMYTYQIFLRVVLLFIGQESIIWVRFQGPPAARLAKLIVTTQNKKSLDLLNVALLRKQYDGSFIKSQTSKSKKKSKSGSVYETLWGKLLFRLYRKKLA